MSEIPIIRNMDEVESRAVERSQGAFIQVLLGPGEGMPRFFTRRFTLEPGGRIPAHRHDALEHEQVVLEGEMVLTLDGQERTVRAGDCIFIPQMVLHAYENRGAVAVRFLCMVPATRDYRTEWME